MTSLRGILAVGLILIAGAAPPARGEAITSYSQMVARIDRDCAASPLIRVAPLGKAASGDRTLWLVRIADPAPQAAPARRVLILCRQHGDEPANTEAALNFLDDIADGKNRSISSLVKQETIYIVPMVNPDGADANTRENSVHADLNRDWGAFKQPETRAVYRAFLSIRPQVVLDMHSWDPGDPFRGFCLEAPRDGVPGDPVVGAAARALQARGAQALLHNTGQQIAQTSYGISADMALCHRFFLVRTNTVALLFETQPCDGGPDLARRVAVAQAAIAWLVSDLAEEGSWKQVAIAERRDRRLASAATQVAPAKPVFLAVATEQAPPASSPISSAVRIVRSAARRAPAAAWWALAIYLLLCIARPIFTPGAKADDSRGVPGGRGIRQSRNARGPRDRAWRRV